ncbi:glycosyltransferase family 2 protein [Steroidobacter flavus]|uniref:Glycosyltransferase family 2 protein n=1 Tax=Steroidobacter flavus TaxID=1842136 RepID=A0ABV8SXD0_9GAMM
MSSDCRDVKLSICITTFNRRNFIGATLRSILDQCTDECELLVLDGGSTDDTELVVSEYVGRSRHLRYVRRSENGGFDLDCDCAVHLAIGQYCWLMTDDDLLKPGAVAAVLDALRQDPSLVIVNAELRDFEMRRILQPRWLNFGSDRLYRGTETDRLFAEVGDFLKYIGGVVIKRRTWISRDRKSYYGSLFLHLGVIFQDQLPGDALVIARPYISYRIGNSHTFSPNMFETFMIKWPALVWSLAPSDAAKRKVCSLEPWREFHELLQRRGLGYYSLNEYRRWIRPQLRSFREKLIPVFVALLPGVLVNAFFMVYYSLAANPGRSAWYPELRKQMLRGSRFHFRNWRISQ